MALRKAVPPPQEKDFEASADGLYWLELVHQRLVDIRSLTFSWNPASLAAATHAEEAVTVPGLNTDDIILAIIKPTFTQGFQVGQGRISATDTLAVQIVNGTGSSADPVEETYTLIYIKNSKV